MAETEVARAMQHFAALSAAIAPGAATQRAHLRRGQRDVVQAHLLDLTGEEVEVGLQAADAEIDRSAPGAPRAGRGGLLRAVDVEHHRSVAALRVTAT